MAAATLLLLSGCTNQLVQPLLPPVAELSPPRGMALARTIVHLHSPWSYDACDGAGSNSDGTVNEECLQHLRNGLCKNRIDFAFMTDHPSHMRERTFEELLLKRGADELETDGGFTVANHLEDCGDGHRPRIFVGFEGQLLGVGLRDHFTDRAQYDSNSTDGVTAIRQAGIDGIALVPHTEKWAVSDLVTLIGGGLQGIEVFNLHAQLDPKIRRQYLDLDPFLPSLDLLPYWLDPFRIEQADLAFLAAGKRATLYERTWDQLLSQGLKPWGVAASDSHENILPGKTRDDERMDSHRRVLRWVSNHLLMTGAFTYAEAKAALVAGRFNMVFEALGSPVGVDFHAEIGGSTLVEVGGTGTFTAGQTHLKLARPTLHPLSPTDGSSPFLTLRLYQIGSDASRTLVSESAEGPIDYLLTAAGIFRAEIRIIPRHLSGFLNYDLAQSKEEHTWVLTNPIYLQ